MLDHFTLIYVTMRCDWLKRTKTMQDILKWLLPIVPYSRAVELRIARKYRRALYRSVFYGTV
jgi:hypothetical protein